MESTRQCYLSTLFTVGSVRAVIVDDVYAVNVQI